MNTNKHNKQEGKNINPLHAEDRTSLTDAPGITTNEACDNPGSSKKKYHSSAMYATSKLHDVVAHVRPKHTGLNL